MRIMYEIFCVLFKNIRLPNQSCSAFNMQKDTYNCVKVNKSLKITGNLAFYDKARLV